MGEGGHGKPFRFINDTANDTHTQTHRTKPLFDDEALLRWKK